MSFLYFVQTLQYLGLGNNRIGSEGIRYLSEALQHNTVMPFIFFTLLRVIAFPVGIDIP